jgi:hypothetical protein
LDFQLLEVKQGNFPPVLIVNIYNQDSEDEGGWTFDRMRLVPLPDQIPVVMTGDWNTHHGMWEVMQNAPDNRAQMMADWIVESGLSLLNEHDEPTYQSHDGRFLSVLDLTLANPIAAQQNTVKDWSLIPELSSGSDHYALHWTFDNGITEVDNLYKPQFNWAKADWDKFQKVVRETVLANIAFNPLRLARLPTEEELEAAALGLEIALKKGAAESVPLKKPSAKAQPWFTGSVLDDRSKMVTTRLAERKAHQLGFDAEFWGADESAITASNRFKHACKRAKKKYYQQIVNETTSQNLWDRHRWVKGGRQYPSPPIQ